jgi:hypothetical protein
LADRKQGRLCCAAQLRRRAGQAGQIAALFRVRGQLGSRVAGIPATQGSMPH